MMGKGFLTTVGTVATHEHLQRVSIARSTPEVQLGLLVFRPSFSVQGIELGI